MGTSMHRLQISLPDWQVEFLAVQAKQEGTSIAEVIRRLINREAQQERVSASQEGLWEIVGIAEDHGALIEGVAVSEKPELYLVNPPATPDQAEAA